MKNLWNPNPMTAEGIVEKGEAWRKNGIRLALIGVCCVALLIVTMLIAIAGFGGWGLVNLLTFSPDLGEFMFASIFVVLGYVGVVLLCVGSFIYVRGVQFIGLGKIACNTKKE